MRYLFWGIVVLALGWSGYWFVGSRTVEAQSQAWFEDRRAEGWAADVAAIETTGFPNRFDTTLTDLRLADPTTGVGWVAPFFQILAFSYDPTSVIAVWPERQELFAPDGKVVVTSKDMRASVDLAASDQLALRQAVVELDTVQLTSDTGWQSALRDGLLAMRLADAQTHSYDIFFEAQDMRPGALLKGVIDPQNRLPDVFQTALLDVNMRFDRPWDRSAVEDARPQPTGFDLRNAKAQWGELEIRLAGDGTVDAAGQITGEVTLKVTNWREVLALGVESRLIPDGLAQTLEGLLGGLARASGPPNTLDIPLTLESGDMRLGFIPLGRAPILKLR